MIPNAAEQPTMRVEEAAKHLGISRASGYEAVRAGEIPAIRLGRRLVVPTAALRTMLGMDANAALEVADESHQR